MRTRKRTKLTPFGKLLALVLLLVLGAVAGATGATATRPHAQAWRCIEVRPGDTLWDLAGRVPGDDHREAVFKIGQENGLLNGAPQAGDAIWIPSEADLHGLHTAPDETCPAYDA